MSLISQNWFMCDIWEFYVREYYGSPFGYDIVQSGIK
jgi:hypothetical protein